MIAYTQAISITCCSQPALEIDLAIKEIFNAQEGEYWAFWKEKKNRSLKGILSPQEGAHKLEYAVWSPLIKENCCVFISNRQDGGHTVIHNISLKLRYEMISVYISSLSDKYPLFNFQYYKYGREIRRIYLMLDSDKWIFYSSGDALDFEDKLSYLRKKVQLRFSGAQIIAYLKALGWNLDIEKFWFSDKSIFFGKQLKFKRVNSTSQT